MVTGVRKKSSDCSAQNWVVINHRNTELFTNVKCRGKEFRALHKTHLVFFFFFRKSLKAQLAVKVLLSFIPRWNRTTFYWSRSSSRNDEWTRLIFTQVFSSVLNRTQQQLQVVVNVLCRKTTGTLAKANKASCSQSARKEGYIYNLLCSK